MKSNILCIFEGEVREHKYFRSVESNFFENKNILKCSYGNDIFELYKDIEKDSDLDIVELIRESNNIPKNKELLSGLERDDINQVYLFFDMECHDDNYSSINLLKMIDFFCEETDNGKLFISYPMIESIRDILEYDNFISHTVDINDCKNYKHISSQGRLKDFQDPRKIDADKWKKLVRLTVIKVNAIVYNSADFPKRCPEQALLLEKQIKHMKDYNAVYIVSSFPVFIYHQFGIALFQ